MDPKQVFISYQRAKARHSNRGYRIPKNWDKVMSRKDWPQFEMFAQRAEGQLRLLDIDKFFNLTFLSAK